MSGLASKEFLAGLKALYPLKDALRGSDTVLRNPWYVIAAVAYGSSNRPEAVPVVWQQALEDLKQAQASEQKADEAAHKEQLLLARRMREGLLKGGLLCGYSRASYIYCKLEYLGYLRPAELLCSGDQRIGVPTRGDARGASR